MAKQFDQLFEEITSFENLWLASKRAAKGKRGQVEVADFAINADWRILEIQAALKDGTWHALVHVIEPFQYTQQRQCRA